MRVLFDKLQEKNVCPIEFDNLKLLINKIESKKIVNLTKIKKGKVQENMLKFIQTYPQKILTVIYLHEVLIESKEKNKKNY